MIPAARSALVTGGAGFLGSHLCERLIAEGLRVVCIDNLQTGRMSNLERILDHPAFSFVQADIVDALPAAVADADYAEVYNLACAASPPAYQLDPEHTLLTCVLGTRQALQIAERCGAVLLLTSTSEIYGDPLEHPQNENYRGNVNPIGPRACYDEGKRAAETLCFDYDRSDRVVVRVARIFNTYGPRLRTEDGRVVSNMIDQALSGDPLTVYGSGEQTRSFCYVDDQIDGLIALIRHRGAQPGPINIGSSVEITVLDLAERILALTHSTAPLIRKPLPIDDPQRRRPDIMKAATVLGWSPGVELDLGLRRTIAWFEHERRAIGLPRAA